MSGLKLHLFGEPRLELEGETLNIDRQKAFGLLAYLAMSQYRQRREILASLFWPDLDQDHAYSALRTTLSSITSVAPGDWLVKERLTLAIQSARLWVDVIHFQSLLDRTRAHHHDNSDLCKTCVESLNEAIDLYRADFMASFSIPEGNEYDQWQTIQRESLRREAAYALRRLAEYYNEGGDFESALDYARRWLVLDVLHEPAHRLLMRLYAANGQRNAAIRQYQQCVEILDRELASPPEEETTQLYMAIQTTTASPLPVVTGVKGGVLPALPSLVIGREQTLRDIKRHLGIDGDLHPTTVIQGWPGVGKSTTVAALAHDPDVFRSFPNGVLWTSLGETPNLLSELSLWATALGLKLSDNPGNIDAIRAQLAIALHDRRMLLIVDDVWQIEHAAPFKVGGQDCATILTSRFNDIAQSLAPSAYDVYRLSVLSEESALELLGRLTPETVKEYPVESRELVRSLEGLPLAIQVAGRLLHTEARLGWGVKNLLAELHVGETLLEAQVPGDLVQLGLDTSPTIAALLRRSTDTLDPEMRQRFAMLGVFVPKPASFDLGAMAAAWQTPDPKPFARILVNRGLLEPITGGRFQMHALLVLHARTILAEMEYR